MRRSAGLKKQKKTKKKNMYMRRSPVLKKQKKTKKKKKKHHWKTLQEEPINR